MPLVLVCFPNQFSYFPQPPHQRNPSLTPVQRLVEDDTSEQMAPLDFVSCFGLSSLGCGRHRVTAMTLVVHSIGTACTASL